MMMTMMMTMEYIPTTAVIGTENIKSFSEKYEASSHLL